MRVTSALFAFAFYGATMVAGRNISKPYEYPVRNWAKIRKQDLLATRLLDAIKELTGRFGGVEKRAQRWLQERFPEGTSPATHSKLKTASANATAAWSSTSDVLLHTEIPLPLGGVPTSSDAILHTEFPLGGVSTTSEVLLHTEIPRVYGVPGLHGLDARDEPPFLVTWYTPAGWTANYVPLATGTAVTTDSAGNPVEPSASPTESAEDGAASLSFSLSLLLGVVTATVAMLA